MTTTAIETCHLTGEHPDGGTLRVTAELHRIGDQAPYFSVTGDLYEQARLVACGCMHDDVRRIFPELTPVVQVHLSDEHGVPMHAVANGHYWLGFTKWEPANLDTFAKMWRISAEEADQALAYVARHPDTETTEEAVAVLALAMTDRWQADADRALAVIRAHQHKE